LDTIDSGLDTLWALAQVESAPCGGFRSKNPVETLFNDIFSLNQGMKRVCTAFLERKPPQGADSTWASAHTVINAESAQRIIMIDHDDL
jgi:hypothetical protein